jgi:hypothetical protein
MPIVSLRRSAGCAVLKSLGLSRLSPPLPRASRRLTANSRSELSLYLRFLMLHPMEIFDGEKSHHDPSTMPMIASRDLRSPVASLRLEANRMSRELDTERGQVAEKNAAISRLEGECGAAKSSRAAASAEAKRLGDRIVQLRATLDDETARAATSEAEIAALREELRDIQAQWNAERSSLECSLASVHTAPRACGSSRIRMLFSG